MTIVANPNDYPSNRTTNDWNLSRTKTSPLDRAQQKVAVKLGQELDDAERKLMDAYRSKNSDEIAKWTLVYQKAERMFTTFMTLMRDMHQRLMQQIHNLKVS